MIIDFHTHVFPDKIAKRTIEKLEGSSSIKAFADGTLNGLQKSMKAAGIDISVVLPVVTSPGQFLTVNNYAKSITSKNGIISFGGIHPDSMDYKGELEHIKELGLLGIKLHPDYQGVFIDDERYVRIIRYAMKLNLWTVIHAGIDIAYPDVVHCTPKRTVHMLNEVTDETKENKIILAHTGGYRSWDEVEEYIAGKNVYMDTSFTLGQIDNDQFVRIVKKHGAQRVLFGSDFPWDEQKKLLEILKKMPLDKQKQDLILHQNAFRIFKWDKS